MREITVGENDTVIGQAHDAASHFDAGFDVGVGKINDNDQRCQHLIRQRDEARKVLLKIRDVFVTALRRDAREPDKTLCHAGGIAYELALVVPEHAFPRPVVKP